MDKTSTANRSADVILIRNDGAIILQIRDNKPGISNPGYASTFGGHVEPGENPLDAAVREINEETNLNLTKDLLTFYTLKYIDKTNYGLDLDIYYYIAKDVEDRGLKVYEGSGFVVVSNRKELLEAKPTRVAREVVEEILSQPKSKRFR